MIEIDFQEKYNKPIVLYNGCICRTRVSNDKITIIEDFDTCNLQEIDKIKIVEIMNKNWDKVSFKEGQKHMDILIDGEPFFRSFWEEELWLHPMNKYIKPEKYNYYDIWGKNFT